MEFVAVLGYRTGESVHDPAQNVHLLMCTHQTQPAIEIIWPGVTSGPVNDLVNRHASGIVYHVCYKTDNLEMALNSLKQAGLRPHCISAPKPAVLFNGRFVSFYNVVGIGLLEILE